MVKDILEMERELRKLRKVEKANKYLGLTPKPSSRGVGRPKGSYKFGDVDCFTVKAINSRVKALRKIRLEILKDLEEELEQLKSK